MNPDEDASTAKLIQSTSESLSALLPAEIALLRAALKVSIKRLVIAIAIIVCAAIIIFVGLIVLAMTSVDALVATGMPPAFAGLAVGAGLVALALIMVVVSLMILKRVGRGVVQPIKNIGLDAQTVKAAYHDK
jgi:TRAP-type C4-dicarboxylate transport system permease small subunit